MYPLSHSLSFQRFKNIGKIPQRNLSYLLPRPEFCKHSNVLRTNRAPHLLCCSSTRCLSYDSISNSKFAHSLSEKVTQNEFVYGVQQKLIDFHDISGLPWWGVIVTSTILVRTFIIFPIATHQQYVLANVANINKELNSTVKDRVTKTVNKLAEENKWDAGTLNDTYCEEMEKHQQELYKKYNSHPGKSFILILIQVPIWVTLSAAIRNISSMAPVRDGVAIQAFLEMKASGFSIFKDLTVPDSTWTLPLLVVISNLIIIQLNVMSGIHRNSIIRTIIINAMRGFSVCTFPLVIYAPKCMTLYWLTSSLCGLIQNILFIKPKTRKFLRIPPTDSLRKDPFNHIKNRFKSIFLFLKY